MSIADLRPQPEPEYDEDHDDCARVLQWAGGENYFTLNHPYVLRSLEGDMGTLMGPDGKVNANKPGEIISRLKRFENNTYSLRDVSDTIWHGLYYDVGRKEADRLIAAHVAGKPIAENALLAYQLLTALFVGKAEEKTNG